MWAHSKFWLPMGERNNDFGQYRLRSSENINNTQLNQKDI
jgi:hypothetical protein